jgi:HEAT repeat protein
MADTDTISKLIEELKCDDGIQCRKARLALVKLGSIAVPALIEGTKNTNSTVRWEALKALSQIGNQQAIDTLVDHLGDSDGRGWVAADGLARIGQRAVIPVLEAIVGRSGSSDFRDGAHHFLSKLSIDDQQQTIIGPVNIALEGSQASLESPIAAKNALSQMKPK